MATFVPPVILPKRYFSFSPHIGSYKMPLIELFNFWLYIPLIFDLLFKMNHGFELSPS